ncbi:TPA: hypothetical protein ACQVG8_000037 [Serratia marcescens]|nr:hypothetical protein [Serratia marcescens]
MSDSLINKGDIAQHAAAESIDRSTPRPKVSTAAPICPPRPGCN